MNRRSIKLSTVFGAGLLGLALYATPASAQVQVCSSTDFATAAGTTACNGSASPVSATATVRTSARLTLEQIFGAAAGGLTVAFGNIDAFCLTAPAAGVSCAADTTNNTATWYGDVQFKVRLGGIGIGTAKLTGVRPSAGSVPAGQLLDGVSGAAPTTAYPVSPSTAIDLRTALANGNTTVTRAFGVKVTASDAAAAWSSNAQYSVVIE